MTSAELLALCFAACTVVCWFNVYRVIKDKDVKGVSIIPVLVFITTNVVEIAYFMELHDYWNVAGAAGMLTGNVVWLTLCLHYRKQNKETAHVAHL